MTPLEREDEERPTIGPWPVEGDARGYAPRNYRKSDERIREEVCEALAAHGDLDVSDVEVDVKDGEVILQGTVRSRWAKFYAEDLAAGIFGAHDVVNELRIARRGAPTSG
jgi:osmotically-inducible protein OsmY